MNAASTAAAGNNTVPQVAIAVPIDGPIVLLAWGFFIKAVFDGRVVFFVGRLLGLGRMNRRLAALEFRPLASACSMLALKVLPLSG